MDRKLSVVFASIVMLTTFMMPLTDNGWFTSQQMPIISPVHNTDASLDYTTASLSPQCFSTFFVESYGTPEWDYAESIVDMPNGAVEVGATYTWTGTAWETDLHITVVDSWGIPIFALKHQDLGWENARDVIKDPFGTVSRDIVVVGVSSALVSSGTFFIARFSGANWPAYVTTGMAVCLNGSIALGVKPATFLNPQGYPIGVYVVVGTLWPNPQDPSDMDAFVATFDTNLNCLWCKVLRGTGIDSFEDVYVDDVNDIIYAVGYTDNFGTADVLVAKFDANGILRGAWTHDFLGTNESGYEILYDSTNSRFIVAGVTDRSIPGGGGKELFLMVGSSPPFTMAYIYGSPGDEGVAGVERICSIAIATDGDYLIASVTTVAGNGDLMLTKINSSTFDFRWPWYAWRTGGALDDGAFKIITTTVTSTPSVAVAGFTFSFPSSGPEDVLLATFDQPNGHTAAYPYCQHPFNMSRGHTEAIWRPLNITYDVYCTRVEPPFYPINMTYYRRCYRVPQTVDLMVGCAEFDGNYSVIGYKGVGTSCEPSWQRTAEWDIHNIPGDRPRASPCLADLDFDGDEDIMISNARYVPPLGYRNIGNRANPIWERYPAWDAPNLNGYEQNPALADLDEDGDYDLCVAGTNIEGRTNNVVFFENIGNKTHPAWTRKTDWDIPSPDVEWPSPAFADLDFDGDYDLLLGSYTESYLAAWENTGNRTHPAWARRIEWDVTGLPPNQHKKPCFADLDEDIYWPEALFIGVTNSSDPANAKIWAYKNIGDKAGPIWIRKPEWDIPCPNMKWIRTAFARLDDPIHDVAVTKLVSGKTVVCQGYNITFNVTIQNQGDFMETVNWIFFPDLDEDPPIIDNGTLILDPGETKTITITRTARCTKGNYTIWAYVHLPIPFEPEPCDNTFVDGWVFVAMVGDIAGPDSKVDITDVALVSQAFGSIYVNGQYMHPKPCSRCPHNPNTDINNDKKIDITDIAIVSKQFGKTDP
jgi:hypothetical protein